MRIKFTAVFLNMSKIEIHKDNIFSLCVRMCVYYINKYKMSETFFDRVYNTNEIRAYDTISEIIISRNDGGGLIK